MKRRPSAENLAVAVHRGDAGALELLIATFERPLYTYAAALLQNPFDAQEVVQDAFLRAHKALTRQYDEARCEELLLRPWLFRTARNLALNRRRSKMLAAERPLESVPEPSAAAHDVDLEHAQEAARLHLAVNALPEEARELVTLRFIDELSYAEIAKTVGSGEAALRGKVFRALKLLRTNLESTNPNGRRSHAL